MSYFVPFSLGDIVRNLHVRVCSFLLFVHWASNFPVQYISRSESGYVWNKQSEIMFKAFKEVIWLSDLLKVYSTAGAPTDFTDNYGAWFLCKLHCLFWCWRLHALEMFVLVTCIIRMLQAAKLWIFLANHLIHMGLKKKKRECFFFFKLPFQICYTNFENAASRSLW